MERAAYEIHKRESLKAELDDMIDAYNRFDRTDLVGTADVLESLAYAANKYRNVLEKYIFDHEEGLC